MLREDMGLGCGTMLPGAMLRIWVSAGLLQSKAGE
jgi:hypothetical protein